jgi:hypothetical protein
MSFNAKFSIQSNYYLDGDSLEHCAEKDLGVKSKFPSKLEGTRRRGMCHDPARLAHDWDDKTILEVQDTRSTR